MEQKPTPEIIGLISSEEHEALLAHDEEDPRLHELRERLGDTAGVAVAILTSEGEDGIPRYVVIGGGNIGDSLRNHEAYGLPDPALLSAELKAQQASEHVDSTTDQGNNLEEFNATLIEQLEATKPAIDFVDTAVETSKSTATVLADVEDMWKRMKIYGEVNHAGVSDVVNALYGVRQRIMDENEPTTTIMTQLNAIHAELEAMQGNADLEAASDLHERDKASYALVKTEEGLQEAVGQLRSTNYMREDIVNNITTAITELDQMLQDSWGREAYEARISQILDKLVSDPHLQPYVTLSRAQTALEDVTRIKGKLISKEW